MRVLESSCFVDKNFQPFSSSINTFIKPGHSFKVCSGFFTNFHLPKSTLFILVNAFIGIQNGLMSFTSWQLKKNTGSFHMVIVVYCFLKVLI